MGTSEESPIRPISSINRVTIHILKRMLLESRQRKSSSSSILQNAYISLKACPVPFQNIEELNQLSGFESEVFRTEIQRRVETWCTEHGRMLSKSKVNNIDHYSSNHPSTSAEPKTRAVQRTLSSWTEGESTTVSSTSKQAKDLVKSKSKKKTANPTPVKQYIPQHRSGTHGIMVALFGLTPNQINDDNDEGEKNSTEYYFSKATIISHAQAFSDVKYIPAKGPSHFGTSSFAFNSAWSGMKTLINRGYVFRKGNPARFGLSSLGWKIGKCSAEKEKDVSSGCFAVAEPPLQEKSKEKSKNKQTVSNDDEGIGNSSHVLEEETVDRNTRPTPPIENPAKITQKLKKSKKRACTSQRELLDTSSADEDMEEIEKEKEIVFANEVNEPLQSIMDTIRNSEKENVSKKALPSDSIIKPNHSNRNVIDLISSDDIDMVKENIENLAHKQHPEPLSPLQGRQRRRRIS